MRFIYSILLILLFINFGISQNIPIDFEDSGFGATWTWTVFENDDNPPLEIIDNPDPSGINASPTVAKFTARQTGQPFAGCETMHGADIGTFTIDDSTATITIMVWKSVISDVGIKLVREDGWSLGEIKIPNTVTNEWEQLTFDFTDHIGLTYDQLVVFPDFQERAEEQVIYFDNIFGGDGSGTTAVENLEETSVELFPNPTQGAITIRSDKEINEVQVMSVTGKEKLHFDNIGTTVDFDISNWASGMYIVRTTVRGKTFVEKIIKR